MTTPNEKQPQTRISDLLWEEELVGEEALWYLSFAEPGKFLGACVISAKGGVSAVRKAHTLGINPGGQCLFIKVPGDAESQAAARTLLNRLASEAELRADYGGKDLNELEEIGISFYEDGDE